MRYKAKKQPQSQVELSVQIDGEQFKKYWEQAYEKTRLGVTVKGFRPGTAPKEIVDPLIDKEKVFDTAAQAAVKESLAEITEENQWQIIDQPKIDVAEASPDQGLSYTTTITLFPETQLGDYRGVAEKIIAEFDKKISQLAVTEAEINQSLDWLLDSRAAEVRSARPAKNGDVVQADIKSAVGGQLLPGGELKKERFVVGKSNFLPGFDEKIINHAAGETLNFVITVPADYWNKDLQGRTVNFTVVIHSIFERQRPALNNDFAASLGPNFKTVDDLRESIRDGALAEKKNKEREKMRLALIDGIAAQAKCDPPAIMVQRTLDGMVADLRAVIEKTGKNESEIRAELQERAEKNVLNNLIMHAIARQEKLFPSPEEIEIEKSQTPAELLKRFDARSAEDYIYGVLLNKKVFEYLESIKK